MINKTQINIFLIFLYLSGSLLIGAKKVEKDNKNQPDYIPLLKQVDAIDELKTISNLSIDCIITSPPY